MEASMTALSSSPLWLGFCSEHALANVQRASRVFSAPCKLASACNPPEIRVGKGLCTKLRSLRKVSREHLFKGVTRSDCTRLHACTAPERSSQGQGVFRGGEGPYVGAIAAQGAMVEKAMATAFSTMVFMLRAIQNYAMHLSQHLSPSETNVERMLSVQREMHASLLWLFQTIFSATPALMVSVMLLSANFTVHSAGSLATSPGSLAQQTSSEVAEHPILLKPTSLEVTMSSNPATLLEDPESVQVERSPVLDLTARAGPVRISCEGLTAGLDERLQDRVYMQGLLEQAVKEMELEVPYHHVRLDQEVIRQLVAPLSVKVDSDNYACFDRTELQYLDALAKEPSNALLLGNMAMFMYVVRKDKERAHTYFKQALAADPEDGETLSRYASFLWLGLGNFKQAESAYKAAIAADPSNPYFTGSYAHFLWHAQEEETSCPISGC